MRYSFAVMLFFISISTWAGCERVNWDETVTLKKINDGDTVTLENGRLVRFIGINTPEINHRNPQKSDPYAQQAKALLERYIRPGDKLHLVFDKSKQDKYGRKLAYVYSKTGRNLALLQLQAGFAKHWVIGKNDKFWQCFQSAERQARLRKKAIWSGFKPLTAKRLQKSDKGYVYVKGSISELEEDKKGLHITLDKQLFVFISRKNLKRFLDADINFSRHDKLLITGKLNFSRNKAKLTLYHPAQILP
ncbi:nuclease [Psychromonas sp. psych-6C06]|uniref:thermonuclease family protein n=1 Tax=Psychromonas sp. psych-6C06 TaxID=2058089 RepID=UPI000C349C26|nr:thermonuclease family protein [Psychromonas sp. psych-6C06]PKF62299.1 nuclease [Psychromonas sp. psych-6C06]